MKQKYEVIFKLPFAFCNILYSVLENLTFGIIYCLKLHISLKRSIIFVYIVYKFYYVNGLVLKGVA